jgi:hypothetical protein
MEGDVPLLGLEPEPGDHRVDRGLVEEIPEVDGEEAGLRP